MSNKKQQKNKKKSKMSPEAKDKLVTGFQTLISNDACIKAGRNYHWWMPVILAICSVIITLVPSFVLSMQTKIGENVLSTSYGVENGLASFQDALNGTGKSVVVDENGKLDVEAGMDSGVYNAPEGAEQKTYYEYKNENSGDLFRVVFAKDGVPSDYLINFSSYQVEETVTSALENGSEVEVPTKTTYRCSILVFEESSFVFANYPNRSTTNNVNGVYYTYDRVHGMDLNDLTPKALSLKENPQQYVQAVRDNYASFLTTCYTTQKIHATWVSTGILAAINTGVILLMGLILFLVTRGKKNPYRVITFWQNQKIAYWAAPAPAILALAFGFLFGRTNSTVGMFLFLFMFGMRIMWLSMKSFSGDTREEK